MAWAGSIADPAQRKEAMVGTLDKLALSGQGSRPRRRRKGPAFRHRPVPHCSKRSGSNEPEIILNRSENPSRRWAHGL